MAWESCDELHWYFEVFEFFFLACAPHKHTHALSLTHSLFVSVSYPFFLHFSSSFLHSCFLSSCPLLSIHRSQGLRIAPESAVLTGAMFGKVLPLRGSQIDPLCFSLSHFLVTSSLFFSSHHLLFHPSPLPPHAHLIPLIGPLLCRHVFQISQLLPQYC